LSTAVRVDQEVVVPEGATLAGSVTDVERSGRVSGLAHLAFTFDRVEMEGMTVPLHTHAVRYEAESSKSEDATKVGAGAIGGAIIGGILGGAKGAARGAAIGGAAGAGAVLVMRGTEVTLPAGTGIVAALAAPVPVQVPIR
jgi:hypothetical protein